MTLLNKALLCGAHIHVKAIGTMFRPRVELTCRYMPRLRTTRFLGHTKAEVERKLVRAIRAQVPRVILEAVK